MLSICLSANYINSQVLESVATLVLLSGRLLEKRNEGRQGKSLS